VTVAELVELLDALGSEPSEPDGSVDGLSALDHALQCAFELAGARPRDDELQLAGLVHDIGHGLGSDEEHGRLGAELVRSLLGERVAGLVAAHVEAKRYLVATDVSYRARLSTDSVRTLALQGGAMAPGQVAAFASSPWASDALVLRRADDAAKVAGRAVPPLAHWVPVLGARAR
jgi:predicted HD phosphohydrolase